MAYKVIILYQLYMPSYFLGTFTEYPKLEAWKGFSGIRNEEDYLITPDGARRLGKYKPMTIGEVEGMK